MSESISSERVQEHMKTLDGTWINDNVQILGEPFFDEEIQAWLALANAYSMLAMIELRVWFKQEH